MTEKRRYLIEYAVVKPAVDALALGAGTAAFATVLHGPVRDWSLIGGGFSLVWYWVSVNLAKPKKAKAGGGSIGPGSITLNTFAGSRKISRSDFNYQPYQPGYVSRETFGEMVRRWVKGMPRIRQAPLDAPIALREFVFRSGMVELSEDDVHRFLRAAWRNRHRGSGLSQRRWVRDWQLRPQWYKDLGTHWYFAIVFLLREAELITHQQLVVPTGPQWVALARDPHTTFGRLKEAEAIKRGTAVSADELSVNYDRGKSSF